MQIIRDRRARNSVATLLERAARRVASRRQPFPTTHESASRPTHRPPTRSLASLSPPLPLPRTHQHLPLSRQKPPRDVRIRRCDTRGRSRRLRGCNAGESSELHFNFIGSTLLLRGPFTAPRTTRDINYRRLKQPPPLRKTGSRRNTW